MTFGSFNHIAKATPVVLELWARILREVPESRLMLKANGLAEQSVQQRISDAFEAGGVRHNQLVFRGKQTHLREHLSQYDQVDLAPDPFPYNGTTTRCEAMWMGVPVVTVAGEGTVGRVGASLLSSVAWRNSLRNQEEYVRIAVELARDRSRLCSLREGMRQRIEASALRDEKGFAKDVEQACERCGSSGASSADAAHLLVAVVQWTSGLRRTQSVIAWARCCGDCAGRRRCAEDRPDVDFAAFEEAGAEHAVGGEAQAVAGGAEGGGHGADEADAAERVAVGEAVDVRGADAGFGGAVDGSSGPELAFDRARGLRFRG